MGIGRFAFTPLLPLMARDGQLDLAAGGWLAAANYAGYLPGALTASRAAGWAAGARARRAGAPRLLTAAMAPGGPAGCGWRAALPGGRGQSPGCSSPPASGAWARWPRPAAPTLGAAGLCRRRHRHRAGRPLLPGRAASAGCRPSAVDAPGAAGRAVDRTGGVGAGAAAAVRQRPAPRNRPRAAGADGSVGLVAATACWASATSCPPPSCRRWRAAWSTIRACSGWPGRCSAPPPRCPPCWRPAAAPRHAPAGLGGEPGC
jgi:hypothetical protein